MMIQMTAEQRTNNLAFQQLEPGTIVIVPGAHPDNYRWVKIAGTNDCQALNLKDFRWTTWCGWPFEVTREKLKVVPNVTTHG